MPIAKHMSVTKKKTFENILEQILGKYICWYLCTCKAEFVSTFLFIEIVIRWKVFMWVYWSCYLDQNNGRRMFL